MEPTNDHERAIAQAVDENFLKDPNNHIHSDLRDYLDVAMLLDFTMTASDSQFLVSYAHWRVTRWKAASNSK